MTDSTGPREGWWIIERDGKIACVKRESDLWMVVETGYRSELPPGWTLGPRIDDLLRDAARYRWLREHSDRAEGVWATQDGTARWWFEFSIPSIEAEGENSNAPDWDEIDRRIDAEIAREGRR